MPDSLPVDSFELPVKVRLALRTAPARAEVSTAARHARHLRRAPSFFFSARAVSLARAPERALPRSPAVLAGCCSSSHTRAHEVRLRRALPRAPPPPPRAQLLKKSWRLTPGCRRRCVRAVQGGCCRAVLPGSARSARRLQAVQPYREGGVQTGTGMSKHRRLRVGAHADAGDVARLCACRFTAVIPPHGAGERRSALTLAIGSQAASRAPLRRSDSARRPFCMPAVRGGLCDGGAQQRQQWAAGSQRCRRAARGPSLRCAFRPTRPAAPPWLR